MNDQEKITSVLRELHKISGFRISLHNLDFEEIAAYPEQKQAFCSYIQNASELELSKCLECDRIACEKVSESGQTMIYKCRHNLVEAISPLYSFGILTGFLMMGQIRVENQEIDTMIFALEKLGKKNFEARDIATQIPSVKEDMINSFVNIMTVCANYLTLSNAITDAKISPAQLTIQYLNRNFSKKISIKELCDSVGYSKSTVISTFKNEYGTTINAYLNELRLSKARKMLKNNSVSVNEIALLCGFSDQSYFSKVFSAKYGITPSDYRKEISI